MKNRTVIGIICIVIAAILAFAVSPVIARTEGGTVDAVRAKKEIRAGSEIREEDLEVVKVAGKYLPSGTEAEKDKVAGKYASADIFAGDYITAEKTRGDSTSVSDSLIGLSEGELAVTVGITSFADGFSGQLRNGDIVKLFIYNSRTGKVIQPPELNYVSVITTVTNKGSAIEGTSDGDEPQLPETIMLKVNALQASLLFEYSNTSSVCCAFVCHGSSASAREYLRIQENILNSREEPQEDSPEENILSRDYTDMSGYGEQ